MLYMESLRQPFDRLLTKYSPEGVCSFNVPLITSDKVLSRNDAAYKSCYLGGLGGVENLSGSFMSYRCGDGRGGWNEGRYDLSKFVSLATGFFLYMSYAKC